MAKVCIDAGHYGRYNRSPVNPAYFESVQMWALSRYLGPALKAKGIEVVYTRPNMNVDMELTERGKKAKGCDLFISLHSNAASTKVPDYPIAFVPLNGTGTKIGQKLADCVCSTMGTAQKGRTATRKGSTGADYYGVIRGAVSVGVPGIILEHSFHTNAKATEWLLKDDNLRIMAQVEADCIADYLGASKTPYMVRVKIKTLNIRTGPDKNYPSNGHIKPGVYTIVEEQDGWGKLKSGVGWIYLGYTTRI